MSGVADRRSVLLATGILAVVPVSSASMESHESAAGLHDACVAALRSAVDSYETVDLAATAAALAPLEHTTRAVPRRYRLRGQAAIDWMRLHAAVTTAAAGAAYDQGLHGEAATRADRAAALARAAGDGPLAARALAVRARVVRPHSPAVALQIAGAAARIAGRSPTRAMIAGKVVSSACAATGDVQGVRDAVSRAWATLNELGEEAHGRPGFSLDTYSPADLALACAEALTTVGAADEAIPYLERASELIAGSGQIGMIVSVRMAQSRAAVARAYPDHEEAAQHAAEAVALAARRPAEWVARLVRDVSDLAERRTGHGFDDLVALTSAWITDPGPLPLLDGDDAAGTGGPGLGWWFDPEEDPGAGGAGVRVRRAGEPPTVPAPRREL